MRRLIVLRGLPAFLVCVGSLALAGQISMQPQTNVPAQQDSAVKVPSFEVATIKPNHSGDPLEGWGSPPGRFNATNMSLTNLVAQAYNLPANQVWGGPSWIGSERYDIAAKMSDSQYQVIEKLDKSQQAFQVDLMLQSLLADRFKLTVSHRPKELKAYALVVAKGGPKLHVNGTPEPAKPERINNNGRSFSGVVIQEIDSPIGVFAAGLSGLFDHPVIDQTGLKESYDIMFQVPIDPEADRESEITTALQDQLGLKIKSQKATVDTIFIEHLEPPSAN